VSSQLFILLRVQFDTDKMNLQVLAFFLFYILLLFTFQLLQKIGFVLFHFVAGGNLFFLHIWYAPTRLWLIWHAARAQLITMILRKADQREGHCINVLITPAI